LRTVRTPLPPLLSLIAPRRTAPDSPLRGDATGTQYDQSLILNADYTLNSTALGEQGLPWLCPSYGMYYLGCNLAIGATITYVALWYREPIVNAAKAFRKGVVHDAHYAKMRVYSEVPMCFVPFSLLA